MKAYYAAISSSGKILGLEPDVDSAIERVKDMVGGPIAVQTLEEPTRNSRQPIPAEERPFLAERNCQIPKIDEREVDAMNIKDAHQILKPFFAGLVRSGAEVGKYNTVSGMADAWIGQNYKTLKPSQDPGRPAVMMGLTLVPAWHAKLASKGAGPYNRLFIAQGKTDDQSALDLQDMKRKMLLRWTDERIGLPDRIRPGFTLCEGSSQECRDSCLVFAGQNASTRYNTYRKVAQVMALLQEPVAFMRMLVESIDKWLVDCTFYKRPREEMEFSPFFRLNMLSDIPWERLAPWIFRRFKPVENGRPLRWYDYTKVPDRRAMPGFPTNYDLTFSLSGDDENEAYARREMELYDSKVAVVFLGKKKSAKGEWEPILVKGDEATKQIPLPDSFWGVDVVDGDRSDVRPHDKANSGTGPKGVCVGLRWKIPSGHRSGVAPDYKNMSFVTPCYVTSQNEPSSLVQPNPSDGNVVLISAVTPRFQPIIQPMSQAL
jgi:hypothetical protein